MTYNIQYFIENDLKITLVINANINSIIKIRMRSEGWTS